MQDAREIERHKQLLMAVMPDRQTISSHTLLNVADRLGKTHPDTLRHAYWLLVEEGRLVRTGTGVRRGD